MSSHHQGAVLTVKSHKGTYSVFFESYSFEHLELLNKETTRYLVDAKVARLYEKELRSVLSSALVIEANESNKSLDKFPGYIEQLIASGVKRGHCLVAIGGGVLQDITCFLASTLFRGLDWVYFPTTLLAQADSCIGSKSSINVGSAKNTLGTFYPPLNIYISTHVLKTLHESDIRSGIGEMIKVHAIDGIASFNAFAADYDRLSNNQVLENSILKALQIKKRIIEEDEFDRGIRNIMNYGHSFGHAIESATSFKVPHGIAITIGADMANFVAMTYGRIDRSHFSRMHTLCARNYRGFTEVVRSMGMVLFFDALQKDKKNVDANLSLILPNAEVKMEKVRVPCDERFRHTCLRYLEEVFSHA